MGELKSVGLGTLRRQRAIQAAVKTRVGRLMSLSARDAGNAAVEVAILAPLLIAFLAGLLVAMRIQHGSAVVAQAAADAARQASIARSAAQAQADATSSAMTTLRDRDLHCIPSVRLDLSGFNRPVGQSGTVAASVSCTIRLSDLALPGMPGSRAVTKTRRSPIDPYRGKALGIADCELVVALNWGWGS
ncbi:TadE/TadG family type IV pilus assembly protein [Actinomadura chibensis]|uniref:TadE/TadG family type IV pilus assembly protein n=1 Tax=Actinomadura chibensis TaxID=392828 RepID=UPI001C3F471F|nr:TadE/TadG family type IV pilus assembly protein [Actinomadura chibensis]